jgi:hypothetical protein
MKSSARMRSIAEVSPVATDSAHRPFALHDVPLDLFLVLLRAAMAKAEHTYNRKSTF